MSLVQKLVDFLSGTRPQVRDHAVARARALDQQRILLAREARRRHSHVLVLARDLESDARSEYEAHRDLERTARLPQAGFTLIELMITVAIVALLAAIAIPAYATYATRAKLTEGLSLASDAQSVVAEGFMTGGMQGAFAAANAYNAAGAPQTKYVAAIVISAVSATDTDLGTITITYADVANNLQAGADTLKLYPVFGAPGGIATVPAQLLAGQALTNVSWECVSATENVATADMAAPPGLGTLPASLAPANCK